MLREMVSCGTGKRNSDAYLLHREGGVVREAPSKIAK